MSKSVTISRTVKIGASSRKTPLPAGADELFLRDKDLVGFGLRIRPAGSKYVMSGRVKGAGTRRTVTIADAVAMPATAAREAAMTIRNQFVSGIDPVRPVHLPDVKTLDAVATEYFNLWRLGKLNRQKTPPRARSIAGFKFDVRRALSMLGSYPIKEIDIHVVRKFSAELRREDTSGSTKRKAYGTLSSIMQFAVGEGYVDVNPCRLLEIPSGSPARDRYLSPDELRRVWKASKRRHQYGTLIRFLITMPLRVSIAQHLAWEDVDLEGDTIEISADAVGNKNGKAIVLPLTSLAVDILTALPTRSNRCFVGAHGDAVSSNSTAKGLLDRDSDVHGWRTHDLRRTCVTLCAEDHADLDESAADLWLMHSRSGVHAIYQKASRLRSMRIVAKQWDVTLRGILGLDEPVVDNVIAIAGAK